jgi:hypothetical protein
MRALCLFDGSNGSVGLRLIELTRLFLPKRFLLLQSLGLSLPAVPPRRLIPGTSARGIVPIFGLAVALVLLGRADLLQLPACPCPTSARGIVPILVFSLIFLNWAAIGVPQALACPCGSKLRRSPIVRAAVSALC